MNFMEWLLQLVTRNPGFTLFAAVTIIQIAPIKINPWGWIAEQVKKALNSDLITEIGNMKEELKNVKDEFEKFKKSQAEQKEKDEEEKANAARRRILQFADECRRKVEHSEEMFNEALRDIDFYAEYCRTNPNYQNEKATFAIQFVRDAYKESMQGTKRSFLIRESEEN